MISYKPLMHTLVELDMKTTDLETRYGGVLNSGTVHKIKHGQPVRLDTIERLCVFLNVPIEKVVEILRD